MVKRGAKGFEATRIFRRIVCDLRWCDECNVPVVSSDKCGLCGAKTRKVRVVPPGDVRPAFEFDVDIVREAVRSCLGRKAVEKLVPSTSFILLNKVQAFDAAYEVVVDGYSIGIVWYEPVEKRWLFRPAYYGAKIIVDEGCAGFVIVEGNAVPGKIIANYRVIGDVSSRYVALVDAKGNVGLGKLVKGGVAVLKRWDLKGSCPRLGKGRDFKKAIDANIERLEKLERIAINRVVKALRLGKAFVTVSGGKDSTVVAYIASQCGVKNFVFVDTGLELPETYDTVHRLEQLLGSVERIGNPKMFWQAVEVLGPPARDFRWCSRVCKLSHISKWCKSKDANVSVTGQRRYESVSRALAQPIMRSGSFSRGFVVSPIHEWSSLEVVLYIFMRGLPLNPLYQRGFDRVGCFMCPTSRLAEFDLVKSIYVDRWSRWEEVLERWRRRWELPRIWVDLGLWRWRLSYPAEVLKYCRDPRILGVQYLESLVKEHSVVTVERRSDSLIVTMYSKRYRADVKRLLGAAYAVGLRVIKVTPDRVELVDRNAKVVMSCEGVEVYTEFVNKERLLRVYRRALKAWFFSVSALCLGCNLCELVCGKSLVKRGIIDTRGCGSCARCVFVCPISMLAEPIIKLVERVLR